MEVNKMQVRIKKNDERAKLPTYGTEFAAGADLYNMEGNDVIIKPHETVMVPLGFSIEIPEGYAGLIFARSGLATKRGIAPANKVGVVDSDYRGECMVSLHNHTENEVTVEGGERVAQLCIVPFLKAEFEEADELSETVRGSGGFGSTGRK
jgi:dUTP pyrophosphatase